MKKVATIRKYQPKDYENLREVCFVTATGAYTKDKDITAALFCEHYLEREAEHCFVVADKDDNAVGYILCAPDHEKYAREFIQYKLPKVKQLSKKEALIKKLELKFNKKITKNYPAHLHIDIIEDYQRMGLGHKLINKLMLHLDELNVKGLHLGCSAKNEKGCNFYQKLGFKVLKKIAGVVIYGIDVHEYAKSVREKEKNV